MSHELLTLIDQHYESKRMEECAPLYRQIERLEEMVNKLAEQPEPAAPAMVGGHDAQWWSVTASNWQHRYNDLTQRIRAAEAKAHIEKEARQALEAKLEEMKPHALLAANEQLRRIQSGKDKELASLRAELDMALEANRRQGEKLKSVISGLNPDAFIADGKNNAGKYQVHNGVVLTGCELAENNRDAR